MTKFLNRIQVCPRTIFINLHFGLSLLENRYSGLETNSIKQDHPVSSAIELSYGSTVLLNVLDPHFP